MSNIDIRTLAMAIRAVDYKMADIEKELTASPPDQGADLEVELLDYDNAAQKLKNAYLEALRGVSNFPPYEKLVRE